MAERQRGRQRGGREEVSEWSGVALETGLGLEIAASVILRIDAA